MLHPSYSELMNEVNKDVAEGEKPVVSSRYSIVIAAAKRARQIIAGAESVIPDYQSKKPLSVAVQELMEGDVKILSGGDDTDDEEEKSSMNNDTFSIDVDDEELFEEDAAEDAEDSDEKDTEESEEDLGSEEDDYE